MSGVDKSETGIYQLRTSLEAALKARDLDKVCFLFKDYMGS